MVWWLENSIRVFRIKILRILQFLLLPSPLMGENSFESLLLQTQKWWLENSIRVFRIKILRILQFLLLPSPLMGENSFESLLLQTQKWWLENSIRVVRIKILRILQFLLLPSPLMGENSFELKIFLNFNSEESLLLQTQKWWLENSIRVFRIKILKILQFLYHLRW
jgi:hypothetical protein